MIFLFDVLIQTMDYLFLIPIRMVSAPTYRTRFILTQIQPQGPNVFPHRDTGILKKALQHFQFSLLL